MSDIVRIPFKEFVLGARTADAAAVLITISHPELEEPVRLSSDPTSQLQLKPYIRGTRSRLLNSESPEGNLAVAAPFRWTLMTALVPSDRAAGSTAASIVLENISNQISTAIRQLKTPATVDFAVVLASTPDYVDREWCELRTIGYTVNASTVTLSVSREETLRHCWPFLPLSATNAPGQHR